MTLLAWEIRSIVWWFEHSLIPSFLGIGMQIDRFQSCGVWGLPDLLIECKTLMALFFRVFNSSTGTLCSSMSIKSSKYTELYGQNLQAESVSSGVRWPFTWVSCSTSAPDLRGRAASASEEISYFLFSAQGWNLGRLDETPGILVNTPPGTKG